MPIKFIEKYSDIFIETGTFYGDGVQSALNSNYKNITSIEISQKFYDIGKERFKNNPNVNIVLGDSAVILGDIINKYDEQITFWLDGHFSGGDTGHGIEEFPILQELNHIKNHKNKNHIIMIDDIRCWRNYNSVLNFENIISFIQSINENYSFYYLDGHVENDILVCKID
jgi:hypothetical protein